MTAEEIAATLEALASQARPEEEVQLLREAAAKLRELAEAVEISPDDVAVLLAERDRYRAAIDEAIAIAEGEVGRFPLEVRMLCVLRAAREEAP